MGFKFRKEIFMICKTFELGELQNYKYVVILSKYQGRILLSRHKQRDTWETQGGHIEEGETPLEAAKRELYEESGAIQYEIVPFCDYWAGNEETNQGASGVVFVANISKFAPMPESEMQEAKSFDVLPKHLTYPDITPVLFERLSQNGFKKENMESVELWDCYRKDGTVTGETIVRKDYAMIPEGCYHAVSEVFVMHEDGSILLMQRDYKKFAYPGSWECGACGSVLKGESFIMGARRELLEETGIIADELTEIYRFYSKDCFFKGYFCKTNVPKASITLQKGETIDYKWVDKETFFKIYQAEGVKGIKRISGFVENMMKDM